MPSGSCACGAVRFEFDGTPTGVTYCHCSKCRRWHGHVGAYAAVDRSSFRFTESRGLKWFAASPSVKRGFCGECGSTLLWDEAGDPKLAFTPGCLDAPTGLRSNAHRWTGSKGDYYDLPEDGLRRFETQPGR